MCAAVCACESAGGEPVQTQGRHIWSSSRVKATVVGPSGTDRAKVREVQWECVGGSSCTRYGGGVGGRGGVVGSSAMTTEEV